MNAGGSIEVEGGRLRWEAAGSGPPLVLLHGFSFDARSWDPQVQSLAAEHRVVRYDLRGFGGSDVPAGPYRHIDDLRALIEQLALPAPILLGLSLGANVALGYTLEHAASVSGLILASPGLPGHRWIKQRPPEAAAAYARVHGVAAGKEFWLSHPLFDSLRDHPQARAAVEQMVNDYGGWHWQNTDVQRAVPDIRSQLATLDVPLLVISGERDVEGYREIATEIATAVPNARLVRMAGAGHMMNLEQPGVFAQLVLQFTRRVHGGFTET